MHNNIIEPINTIHYTTDLVAFNLNATLRLQNCREQIESFF